MFNALKYIKFLEKVGFTREQAEAHIEILSETMENNLATTHDMKDLRNDMATQRLAIQHDFQDFKTEIQRDFQDFKSEIRQDFQDFKTEIHQDFQDFKSEIRQDFEGLKSWAEEKFKDVDNRMVQMEYRLTIKLGTIVALSMTALGVFVKFF